MVSQLYSSRRLGSGLLGGWAETAYRSAKFLIGLQVPDIIARRVEPSLGDRLHWCGLLGLG
jgi:hypothetical protein